MGDFERDSKHRHPFMGCSGYEWVDTNLSTPSRVAIPPLYPYPYLHTGVRNWNGSSGLGQQWVILREIQNIDTPLWGVPWMNGLMRP